MLRPFNGERRIFSTNCAETTECVCVCVCACAHARSVTQSCPNLCDPLDGSRPGSSVRGIFRQEHWSGLPFPPPGDLLHQGIEPAPTESSILQVNFYTLSHQASLEYVGKFQNSNSKAFPGSSDGNVLAPL